MAVTTKGDYIFMNNKSRKRWVKKNKDILKVGDLLYTQNESSNAFWTGNHIMRVKKQLLPISLFRSCTKKENIEVVVENYIRDIENMKTDGYTAEEQENKAAWDNFWATKGEEKVEESETVDGWCEKEKRFKWRKFGPLSTFIWNPETMEGMSIGGTQLQSVNEQQAGINNLMTENTDTEKMESQTITQKEEEKEDNTEMKDVLIEMNQGVYNTKIFCAINCSHDIIDEYFYDVKQFPDETDAIVDMTSMKKDDLVAILVRIPDINTMGIYQVAHEATHVAIWIFERIRCEIKDETSEPFAYLLCAVAQFIDDCIKYSKGDKNVTVTPINKK